ncbi:MAG: hypothetical protein ACRCZP_13685, partial [Phycicoccus sp.]
MTIAHTHRRVDLDGFREAQVARVAIRHRAPTRLPRPAAADDDRSGFGQAAQQGAGAASRTSPPTGATVPTAGTGGGAATLPGVIRPEPVPTIWGTTV